MSNAFRGQAQYVTPIYSQAPTGGFNMSGYGGDTMQDLGDLGDLGGLANFGAVSGPASMGGGYSMFGSYNPTPYQQQDYTGGYMPGYGAQLPQQFGGYGGGYGRGYGGFASQFGGRFGGGYGGGVGMPQPQQPNVNDLFGQYMFGQYYGQPAFNPFQATSMFGGGRRGGFGGGRRGGRERMFPTQQPEVQAYAPQPPRMTWSPPMPGQPPVSPQAPVTPAPAPVPSQQNQSSNPDYWYTKLVENNPGIDTDRARQLAEERAAVFRGQAQSQQQTTQQPPSQPQAPNIYDPSNDDWGRGEGQINAADLPSGFNWQAYLDAPSNADLRAAGLDTPSEAARHYLKYGRSEGRNLGAAAPSAAPSITQPVNQPATPYFPSVTQPVETTMPYDLGDLSGLSRLGGFDPYGRFGAFNFR